MSDPGAGLDRFRRRWSWLAGVWLVLVVGIAAHQWSFWKAPRVDSDVLALLPRTAEDARLSDVTRRVADASARQLVVMLGAKDPKQATVARSAFMHYLAQEGRGSALPFIASRSVQDWFEDAQTFYAPYRDRLLTEQQHNWLQKQSIDELAQRALSSLYGPVGAPRLGRWVSDPLQLWPGWWQARAASSGMRVTEQGLLERSGRYWVVMQFTTRDSAFRLDGQPHLKTLLDSATAAARAATPDLVELRAGVPLHAEAAAVQARGEINTIGWGSLVAVLLLVWLSFRSLRPIFLVAMSLVIGCAAALSVTVLVFGQIHLVTLVFGASLVGVAEDYGIHWFGSRQEAPAQDRWIVLRNLLPGLCLALLTSILAYLTLGFAPFPGLRQMALFSVVGLAAAFFTVVVWFPFIDRGVVSGTAFSAWVGGTLSRFPRFDWCNRWSWMAVALVVLMSAGGLSQLRSNDDLRSLQSSPPELMAEQMEVGRILGMPSPAQFFLVTGRNDEQVLEREQLLVSRLKQLDEKKVIGGYQAISDWVPSRSRQIKDARLTNNVEQAVLEKVGSVVGQRIVRPEFSTDALSIEKFLSSSVSLPFRHLWLGKMGDTQATVVMVNDLSGTDALDQLPKLAEGLAGVRWVDRTSNYSQMLGHYRRMMSIFLAAGFAIVFLVMIARYRRDSWRVVLPTLLAGVLTLALLGWLHQPLQLFNVLALMLLLGMGIDYGIFVVEHHGDSGAWLSVCVGAASTWLSFGLLALSATPALRAFGITLLLGIGLVWILTPLFRPIPATS